MNRLKKVAGFFGLINEPTEPLSHNSVDQAIFQHLALVPQQVKIRENDWIFSSHALNEWTLNRIYNGSNVQQPIIVGELSAGLTNQILTDPDQFIRTDPDLVDRFLNPSIGSTSTVKKIHVQTLQELLQRKATIVHTDSDSTILFGDGSYHLDYSIILGTIGLLVSLGMTVKQTDIHNITPKDISAILGTAAILVAGGTAANQYPDATAEFIGKTGLLQLKNAADLWLERSLKEKPDFVYFFEGILTLRDLTMALNTWQTIAHSVSIGTLGQQVAVFAGNRHIEIKKKFMQGPDAVEQQVRGFARQLVNYGTQLSNLSYYSVYQNGTGQFTSTVAAVLFNKYGRLFSEPTAIGGQYLFLPKQLQAIKLPRSAKLVLIEEMEARKSSLINQNQLTPEQIYEVAFLNRAKILLLADLAAEMIKLSGHEKRLYPTREGGEFSLDLADSITYSGAQNYVSFNPLIELLKTTDSEFKPGLVVGMIEHHHKTYPVVRLAKVGTDQLQLIDTMVIPGSVKLIAKTWQYRLADINQVGLDPNDNVMVIRIKQGQVITTQVRSVQDAGQIDRFFQSSDEKDRFSVKGIIVQDLS